MLAEWLHWIDGWVYAWFGREGLAAFSALPLLYILLALAFVLTTGLLLLLWGLWRLRRLGEGLRRSLAMVLRTDGRRCLWLAHEIRASGKRLRRSVRQGIEERAERRDLLQLLERFTRSELEAVLDQACLLIASSDDRAERRLGEALERQTRRWAGMADGAERESLQEAIAATRQALARIAHINTERRQLVQRLEEAAAAVRSLESELASLSLARHRVLPEFRDQLSAVSQRLAYLRAAHDELQAPP